MNKKGISYLELFIFDIRKRSEIPLVERIILIGVKGAIINERQEPSVMKLRYLLDTNICIYIAKQRPINVLQKFEELAIGEVGMSTITFSELLYGAEKSNHPKKALHIVEELAGLIPPIPLSIDVGNHYGKIRSKLEKQGKLIGNTDLWIASHALAADLILVTNNVREFARVPKLKIENWVSAK